MLWTPGRCFVCRGSGVRRSVDLELGVHRRCEKCDGYGTLYRRRGSRRWYSEREKKRKLLDE